MRRDSSSPEAPTPAATPAPEATKPNAPPAPPVATTPREEPTPPKAAPRRSGPPASPQAPRAAAPVSLRTVQLCKTFSTSGERWICDSADDPAARGRIVLYTRVKSPRNTTVVHRWYRGDELQQSVRLAIQASVSDGYRTYSQLTINSPEDGGWKSNYGRRSAVRKMSASAEILRNVARRLRAPLCDELPFRELLRAFKPVRARRVIREAVRGPLRRESGSRAPVRSEIESATDPDAQAA